MTSSRSHELQALYDQLTADEIPLPENRATTASETDMAVWGQIQLLRTLENQRLGELTDAERRYLRNQNRITDLSEKEVQLQQELQPTVPEQSAELPRKKRRWRKRGGRRHRKSKKTDL